MLSFPECYLNFTCMVPFPTENQYLGISFLMGIIMKLCSGRFPYFFFRTQRGVRISPLWLQSGWFSWGFVLACQVPKTLPEGLASLNQSNLPSWFIVAALFFYKNGPQQHTGVLQAHHKRITRCWFLFPFSYNFKDVSRRWCLMKHRAEKFV